MTKINLGSITGYCTCTKNVHSHKLTKFSSPKIFWLIEHCTVSASVSEYGTLQKLRGL